MNEQGLTAREKAWVEKAAHRVPPLAARMVRRLPGVSEEDLVSAGYEALTLAAKRYDPESGVPFSGYAHYRVRGAMIDAARRADPTGRRHARALRALEATQGLLEEANAADGPRAEHDRRTLRERVAAAARLVEQSAAAVLLAHSKPVEPEQAPGATPDPEENLDRRRLAGRLERVLESCTGEERALVEALYHRGLTMGAYAEEIGKTKSTVSRKHARLLNQLAGALRNEDAADPEQALEQDPTPGTQANPPDS